VQPLSLFTARMVMAKMRLCAVATMMVILAAGCTSKPKDAAVATAGDGPGGVARASGSGGSDTDKMIAYARCMREHGVPMSDPQVGEDGGIKIDAEVDPQTMEKATDACRTLNPGARGNQDSVDPDAFERSYEFARCMRQNGVGDFPDPGQRGEFNVPPEAERDPDFATATRTCQVENPWTGASPTPGSGR
jgi:hypothetical protein